MAHDDLSNARVGVVAALAEGDSGLAYRLVIELLDEGVPLPVVIDQVLAPIQQESGRRWELGDATVPEEHAMTAAVETVVALLAGAFDQPVEADLVVIACAEGDSHTLPGRMAAALLAYEGLAAIFLGTSVPADELAAYLESVQADALVVSCTRPANLLGARACIAAAHEVGVPVAVGGRAFDIDDDAWSKLGADAHVARLPLLADLLATWTPNPEASEAGAVPVPPAAESLLKSSDQVVTAVEAAVAAEVDPSPAGARLLSASVEELVSLLAVAHHLDLSEVLGPQASWTTDLLAQRTGSTVDPAALLRALADAVAPVSPELTATVPVD